MLKENNICGTSIIAVGDNQHIWTSHFWQHDSPVAGHKYLQEPHDVSSQPSYIQVCGVTWNIFNIRADSWFATNQRETSLHWLGTNLESALNKKHFLVHVPTSAGQNSPQISDEELLLQSEVGVLQLTYGGLSKNGGQVCRHFQTDFIGWKSNISTKFQWSLLKKGPTDNKSILIQVMAWCHQATNTIGCCYNVVHCCKILHQ